MKLHNLKPNDQLLCVIASKIVVVVVTGHCDSGGDEGEDISLRDGGGGGGGGLGKEEISAKRQRGGERGSALVGDRSKWVKEKMSAGIK